MPSPSELQREKELKYEHSVNRHLLALNLAIDALLKISSDKDPIDSTSMAMVAKQTLADMLEITQGD